MEPADGTQPSFESAYRELEEIVAQLERGDLPLERALELHERGQKLVAYCTAQLEQAELRVRKLDLSQEN
jgi:exodeoxyribonuclease VII small subunit